MLNKRLKVAVMAVVIGSLIFANTIYAKPANDAETAHSEDVVTETNNRISGVQPRMMCVKCSSIMEMYLLCLPDTRRVSGQREHKYGLLGTKTCTIVSYDANAAYYCDVCGNTIFLDDNEQPDGLARHHCLEVHSSCGAGNNGQYLVCPFS